MNDAYTNFDCRRFCPADLIEVIRRPHEHEGPNNRPLWIIWKQLTMRDGTVDVPRIDSVCDDDESAIAHVGMVFETDNSREFKVFVERIPANHRFGSSIIETGFIDAFLAQKSAVKLSNYPQTGSRFYRRDGD